MTPTKRAPRCVAVRNGMRCTRERGIGSMHCLVHAEAAAERANADREARGEAHALAQLAKRSVDALLGPGGGNPAHRLAQLVLDTEQSLDARALGFDHVEISARAWNELVALARKVRP